MARKTGMDTKDLDALERAFKRFRVRLPAAAEDALEDSVKTDTRDAAQFLAKRPGASGKYKRDPGAYRFAENRGAPAVEISSSSPTAVGAEFGTNVHWVFGRKVAAKSMKRRVFGARTGRGRLGKVVGKTAERNIPKTERRIAIAFDKGAAKILKREGL